ncbi:MAG: hypothetical protein ACI8WB_000156 [Phenylobacterium sp.]|jgi:hypothetical protein
MSRLDLKLLDPAGKKMQHDYLENRINKLLIAARDMERDVADHQLDWVMSESNQEDIDKSWLHEKDEELLSPFKEICISIYLSVACYLDDKQLHRYLKLFRKIFGSDPKNPKYATGFDFNNYHSGEHHSIYLAEMSRFLSVFEVMESDNKKYNNRYGLRYLENILNNTASIIVKSGENPTSETQIYKQVKCVLEAVFPTAKSPQSSFIKTMKEYKPDILVPELKVAIEYKYAKTKDKLKATVEQIAADVKGYTGDRDYQLFYAVFYVTKDFVGESAFKVMWQEHDFPDNWKYIYVVGT